jgi:hypothetical protein
MLGFETALHILTVPLLRQYCACFGLDAAGKKENLIERLMVYVFDLLPVDAIESDPSSFKGKEGQASKSTLLLPDDLKGITTNLSIKDLTRLYKVDQLKRFCALQDLQTTGKKSVLVSRVYRFLKEQYEDN